MPGKITGKSFCLLQPEYFSTQYKLIYSFTHMRKTEAQADIQVILKKDTLTVPECLDFFCFLKSEFMISVQLFNAVIV